MKVITEPTIELEEKDIETIKGIYELIKSIPCSSLYCNKCPFYKICDYVSTSKSKEDMVLNMQKTLNNALI